MRLESVRHGGERTRGFGRAGKERSMERWWRAHVGDVQEKQARKVEAIVSKQFRAPPYCIFESAL
jgi:hypothetical protein